MKESVRMIDYAGNTVVIKCIAGMAQAVCAAIDAMDMESVVGTVAGEDTIFLLVRQESQVEKLIGSSAKCSSRKRRAGERACREMLERLYRKCRRHRTS